MSEKQPESSWDKLLGDLGAEPDKSAFERHQPESTEIPPELDWEAADAAAEAAQPAAGDWNTLADTLGLEDEAPAAKAKAPEPVAKKPVEAKAEKPKQEKKAKQDSGPATAAAFAFRTITLFAFSFAIRARFGVYRFSEFRLRIFVGFFFCLVWFLKKRAAPAR